MCYSVIRERNDPEASPVAALTVLHLMTRKGKGTFMGVGYGRQQCRDKPRYASWILGAESLEGQGV